MSNFIEEFKKGQKGANKGLGMGEGLENLSKAINGVQRGRIYGIGAAPKVGKTTLSDYAFLYAPYLQSLERKDFTINWIYYSFEISRVAKEFDAATHFLWRDYGIYKVYLDEGVTVRGENYILLSPDYLKGRLIDDNENLIKVNDNIKELLKKVYANRIIPLFGEFDKYGKQIKKGLVTFIREKDNPTGIYYNLIDYAKKNGEFVYKKYGKTQRIIGYKPNDPNKFTIIITDHVRSLLPERGFTKKQTIDKYIQYSTDLRDWCDFTFVHIIHLNRDLASSERLKQFNDTIYPTSEMVKDSGNLSEDADYMLTMFNPNDDRYNLSKHFGLQIKDMSGNPYYPLLRSIHLVESRHTVYPQHFRTCMAGNVKSFKPFKEKRNDKKRTNKKGG